MYRNVDHREPEEDVQRVVTVQLIVARAQRIRAASWRAPIANQTPARHFSRPHGGSPD